MDTAQHLHSYKHFKVSKLSTHGTEHLNEDDTIAIYDAFLGLSSIYSENSGPEVICITKMPHTY